MSRQILFAFVFLATSFAAAQGNPPTPMQQQNQLPNPQQYPPQYPAQYDPNNVAAVSPPTFAPSTGANDIASRFHELRVSGGVMHGRLVSRVDPVYPPGARSEHIQGIVHLYARIGKSGHVQDLEVVDGPRPLQDAAVNAVQHWVYKPYMLNGKPVEVDTIVRVRFDLNPPHPEAPK